MEREYGSQHDASPALSEEDDVILRILRQQHASSLPISDNSDQALPVPFETSESQSFFQRPIRQGAPGLPRAQTFKRQQSERRINLTPVETSLDERRATSTDRRANGYHKSPLTQDIDFVGLHPPPGTYGPYQSFIELPLSTSPISIASANFSLRSDFPAPPSDEMDVSDHDFPIPDTTGMPPEEYDDLIRDEMERLWILNLSMQFRDHSPREKFFVTFRQREHLWRRVTISMDYRGAPPGSLEYDLRRTRSQREKITKIYRAIRENLPTLVWCETVTNLKLQTIDGHLNIHVVEDGNEIITYPNVDLIRHLNCRLVKESQVFFQSHLAGFVYKVRADGATVTLKEMPGQDTVDEFLYEANALHSLRYSRHIARFYGIVVDDAQEHVKGLLIAYADQGALIDILYEECKGTGHGIPWPVREKWARQIIQGLADVHEAGFVQGDFTVSNVVIDHENDAKIIDINRRGCPLGWEPPEATALVESGQRLTLYIGAKSDLYQLGMVLWALAMEEDEPESQGRPLVLGPEVNIPDWYRQITEICLNYDPRCRRSATELVAMLPPPTELPAHEHHSSHLAEGESLATSSANANDGTVAAAARPLTYDPTYTSRGRSPPSPMPSNSSTGRRVGSRWPANAPWPYTEGGYLNPVAKWQRDLIPTPANDHSMDRSQTNASAGDLGEARPHSSGSASQQRNRSPGDTPQRATPEGRFSPNVEQFSRTKSDGTIRTVAADTAEDSLPNMESLSIKPGVAMSWASRPSSADGEHDGGANLARSEADASAADRSFEDTEHRGCSGEEATSRQAEGGPQGGEALSSALTGIGAAHTMRDGVVNG